MTRRLTRTELFNVLGAAILAVQALIGGTAFASSGAEAEDPDWVMSDPLPERPTLTLHVSRAETSESRDTDARVLDAAFPADQFTSSSVRNDGPSDGTSLLVKLAPAEETPDHGRWFVYAAGSGKALGLNLLNNTSSGWRPTGWSSERLVNAGKMQLGVGWREGGNQLSLSATRREIGHGGFSRDDTMIGVSLSMKPE